MTSTGRNIWSYSLRFAAIVRPLSCSLRRAVKDLDVTRYQDTGQQALELHYGS